MERLIPFPWQAALWQQVMSARERLPHALLLHGARGIGKRHMARTLAHALLCESPDAQQMACGRCTGCLLVAADNHPDLRWLVPEADQPVREETEGEVDGDGAAVAAAKPAKASRAILIDQVRELGEFLTLASHRGGRRVVLLAPAEALNGAAANALLKVLEEPPAGAMFVAVTDELDRVIPTVRSRCVLLQMPVPAFDVALAWLRSQGVEDAVTRLAEAGGAPVGLDIDDGGGGALAPELKARLLGLLGHGNRLTLAEVTNAIPKDVPVSSAIRLFQRWGWDLLAERAAGRLRYYPGQQRAIAAVARGCEPQRLLGWLTQLTDAQATSAHPLNAKLAIETALIGYMDATQP